MVNSSFRRNWSFTCIISGTPAFLFEQLKGERKMYQEKVQYDKKQQQRILIYFLERNSQNKTFAKLILEGPTCNMHQTITKLHSNTWEYIWSW